MNFVAHVEVGAMVASARNGVDVDRLDPFLVGAALPDLAGIGRFRLEPGTATGRLAEGIRLHHRTDSVFHADDRFRHLMVGLRDALLAVGVGRGPARACGHVGVELLMDGHLLGDHEVVERTASLLSVAAAPGPQIIELVAARRRAAWREHLGVMAERIDPAAYADPDRVAARLHRMLSYRPALALEDHHVAAVAEALRAIEPAVASATPDLLNDLAAVVA